MTLYSEQPEATVYASSWDREAVVSAMPPFRFAETAAPGEPVYPYLRFYGLELGTDTPNTAYRLGYLDAAGYRLAVHYYHQPGSLGTVFLFHGYLDHTGLYSRIIHHCLDQGMDVLIYDLPGHGLSSGEPTAIQSFREYQRILLTVLALSRGQTEGPWIGIGQSTGSGVLVDYLLSCREAPEAIAFRGVVLLAPLVRPAGFRMGKLVHTLTLPFQDQWKRVFVTNSSDSEFLRFLKDHDPLQAQGIAMAWLTALRRWVSRIEAALPVDYDLAIVQGEQDTTVEWRHNLRLLRRKFRRVRLYQIPEARHHLVNEAEPILGQVLGAVSAEMERLLASQDTTNETLETI